MSGPYRDRPMHPCAAGHKWDNGRGSAWARCTRCQEMTKIPPKAEAPAPPTVPVPAPSAGPPPVPAATGHAGLTIEALGQLKMAGRWGLLRAQSGRRFLFIGKFSMPRQDMGLLVEAAGGRSVSPDAVQATGTWMRDAVDVLVRGEGASPVLVELAFDEVLPVWDEAELVFELLPLPGQLTAEPGQPPF